MRQGLIGMKINCAFGECKKDKIWYVVVLMPTSKFLGRPHDQDNSLVEIKIRGPKLKRYIYVAYPPPEKDKYACTLALQLARFRAEKRTSVDLIVLLQHGYSPSNSHSSSSKMSL